MLRYLFYLSFILLFSCNNDDDDIYANCDEVTFDYTPFTSYLKESIRYDINDEVIYTVEYFFDNDGKVISSNYVSYLYPEQSNSVDYVYDELGRVVTAYINDELSREIKWSKNIAEVFNNQNQKLAELTFCNNRLIEVKTGYLQNYIRYKKYNYDTNDNIISVEDESEIFVEYLDYNTNKTNPYYLLKSIGVLIDWRNTLFSKNIFTIEKVYPYDGGDYYFPLTFYDYEYVFDTEGRVYELEDERTAIYVVRFEYQQ